jgi:4-aminobutyrate aminotransferase / (S)-3-amino-2-methylpropionate transaminase / 5-aminovalerate transaminase
VALNAAAGEPRRREEEEEGELRRLRAEFVPRGVASAHPLVVEHARGSELWDVSGRRYLDFAAGIGTINIGHNHPRVVEAARWQLERLTHSAFQVAMYEPYLRLAERLCRLAPGPGPNKAVFFSTGAEAVENAVKIARVHTGRPAVISFRGGFHGRTLLGLSLTGTAQPYKQDAGPYAPEVYKAPFPYEYRGWSSERALTALEEVFDSEVSPERVAAIVIEPVLGEGGFVPAPPEFMTRLREISHREGILLIADEIQTGFGRTGRFFAVEHSGIAPDLVAVAKSIAAGLPLSGVVGRAEVMDAPRPGGLGGTFGGNPVACAAALAVLEVLHDERLVERAAELGPWLDERLSRWAESLPLIGDVRVLGAMAGLELVRNRESRAPASAAAARVLALCRDRGLLVLKAGSHGNVIRMLPPLSVSEAQLEEGLAVLEGALATVSRERRANGHNRAASADSAPR